MAGPSDRPPCGPRSAFRRLAAAVAATSLAAGCASFDKGGSSEGCEGPLVTVAGVLGGITLAASLLTMEIEYGDAKDYLERRRRPIRVALARGSGLFVDDLATVLELPRDAVPTLGAALQAHQPRLDRWLAAADLTRDDVVGFSDDLRAAIASEPRLTPYVEAARARLTRDLPALVPLGAQR
ncbi:MAG: hypothetical protein EP329_09215 [Deltaproteobacteria bacterium]|nr:MAG: hypothetical protein EP329_09215 [Deltaproteobacteria bacterium]